MPLYALTLTATHLIDVLHLLMLCRLRLKCTLTRGTQTHKYRERLKSLLSHWKPMS